MPAEELWSVSDFARRFRLEAVEEQRLIKLFGTFASAQALLANARRTSGFAEFR